MPELILVIVSAALSAIVAIFEKNILKKDIKKIEGRIHLGRFLIFASISGILGKGYYHTDFYLAPWWLLLITLLLGILLVSVKDRKLFSL